MGPTQKKVSPQKKVDNDTSTVRRSTEVSGEFAKRQTLDSDEFPSENTVVEKSSDSDSGRKPDIRRAAAKMGPMAQSIDRTFVDGTLSESDSKPGGSKEERQPCIDEIQISDTEWYRIDGVLGAGAMGIVYLASHVIIDDEGQANERKVAIKVIQKEDKGMEEQFQREIRTLFPINHENIVKVSRLGRTSDKWLYCVMDYLDGDTLQNSINKHPNGMSWKEAKELVLQMCEGIGTAHDMDIIHRDIKPDNIFVIIPARGKRTIKIVDFGLVIDLKTEQELDGKIAGTPSHMAPEQLRGKELDNRADIYSVGVVLYEMLTGKQPYEGDSIMDLIKNVLSTKHVPVKSLNPKVPLAVSDAIDRCLAKNPEDRFQSIWELRDVLEGSNQFWTAAGRKIVVSVAATVTLIGGIGIGLLLGTERPEPVATPQAIISTAPKVSALLDRPSKPSPQPEKIMPQISQPEPVETKIPPAPESQTTEYQITIKTNIAGARVYLNGTKIGQTEADGSFSFYNAEGSERVGISVRKSGYNTENFFITPDSDQEKTIRLSKSSGRAKQRELSPYAFDPSKRRQ